MLSSKNIHFAILGIIIGASAGYIFAFYQAQSALPVVSAQPSGLPADHPTGVSPADLEALKKDADTHPNDPDVIGRYGTLLFTSGRIEEALAEYEKVIALEPDNLTIRSLLVAILFRKGDTAGARKHLDIALKQDPNHIPTLHGYFLVTLEGDRDVKKAEEILKKIETLSPSYQGLPDLKAELEEARNAQK